MELELSRVDYALVGLTSPNCMQILPSESHKETQKVVIADNDGILQVFSIKKEDVQLHFKSLPGPKITSVQLGGATGTPNDKIFVSLENEVKGFTRKGKLFLTFDSNMTEPIMSMFVLGNDLFLCSKHIYNHYRDCKEIGSYLCGDCIVDIIALQTNKSHRLMTLIACEGRMIRVLEYARVTLSLEVECAPTVLHIYVNDSFQYVLFGTVDGRVGILNIDRLVSFDRWLINNDKNSAIVCCIDSYDMTDDGIKNIVIGRQDGNIEVYAVNIEDNLYIPILLYMHNCNESVTALKCGIVGSHGYNEILVTTYTGRIFGLTTEIIERNVGGDSITGSFVFSADTSQKIIKLKSEIDDIQGKVVKEREKYQAATQWFNDELSAIPLITIKDSMILSKADASYVLSLEVPAAIDNVLLQSDVPLDLLDVEKNSAVVSYSEAQPHSGNFLLATYRCQINTNRLELKIRTIEGQYGILQAYITPLVQPKCCRLKQYEIKPLSLHVRIHNYDEIRSYNTLTLKGSFSLAEIHAWISQCLPEVPEKPDQTDRTVLVFQSSFIDTILRCSYMRGEAEFKCENVSTISILKEYLTKEATKKKIKVDIANSIDDKTIRHVLKLIEQKLLYHQSLSKKVILIDALNELEINEEETMNYLSPNYKDLLLNEKKLKVEFNSQPSYLDRLYGIITDLYVDYYKFKGINTKSKILRLVEILDNYDYETVVSFFCPEAATKTG